MDYHPVGETGEETRQQICKLCILLAETCASGMLIRPHPSSAGPEFSAPIRKALPAVAFDDLGTHAIERFLESELVVHSTLATGWLETLWLDVPTLAYYDPALYAFRERGDYYIKAFGHFGMLHTSPASLVNFYLTIRDDIPSWWQQPDFVVLRNQFVHDYVRVDSRWQHQWRETFTQLLARQIG